MSGVDCPVNDCSFGGTVTEVSEHIVKEPGEMHSWEALDYEGCDEFCHKFHHEQGHRLQKAARETRDHGKFQMAIAECEEALWHFQRAKLYTHEYSTLAQRCEEVLNLIAAIEAEAKVQPIDDLVDEADNAVDAGDKIHFEADSDAAASEYEDALDALEEALALASDRSPDRVPEIERQLRRVRVRRQSLELSELHRSVRDLAAGARDRATAGDRAFHAGQYETAVNEYEAARDRYESLAGVMEEFSFDEPVDDPAVCDVCRQQYNKEIAAWTIRGEVEMLVCPSCARFGSAGNLPKSCEVASEQRSVLENIELIRDGDIGLDWSDEPASSEESNKAVSDSTNRDAREMVIQLVSLYQQLGESPSVVELDEHTDFGYLGYKNEFGSLSEALEAAGLRG